jgi:hypothetical protein
LVFQCEPAVWPRRPWIVADPHYGVDARGQKPGFDRLAALFLDAEADAVVLLLIFPIQFVRIVNRSAGLVDDFDDQARPEGLHQGRIALLDRYGPAHHLGVGTGADQHLVVAGREQHAGAGGGFGDALVALEDAEAGLVEGTGHRRQEEEALALGDQRRVAFELAAGRWGDPGEVLGWGGAREQRQGDQGVD